MSQKTIIINGENFHNLSGFYEEVDRVLTKDLSWETGHNLNAFNDLLCGGFGVFEYDESIELIWMHFAKSRDTLGKELVDILIEIIETHSHIEFKKIY
jgi:RNAse (barnase) inhibitor barstar